MPTNKKIQATLVKRAMIRNFNVSVNSDHIKRAKPNSQAWCMVAIALRDCIPGAHTVKVDSSFIRFSLGRASANGLRYAFPTPDRVKYPIQEFDSIEVDEERWHKIKPFRFQLSARQAFINPMISSGKREPAPKGKTPVKKPCAKKSRWNGMPIIVAEAAEEMAA